MGEWLAQGAKKRQVIGTVIDVEAVTAERVGKAALEFGQLRSARDDCRCVHFADDNATHSA